MWGDPSGFESRAAHHFTQFELGFEAFVGVVLRYGGGFAIKSAFLGEP